MEDEKQRRPQAQGFHLEINSLEEFRIFVELIRGNAVSEQDADKLSSLTNRLGRAVTAQRQVTADNTPEKG